MKYLYTLLIISSLSLSSVFSQLDVNPTTPKGKRRLKNRVLTNTDHGYVGLESGFIFNIGPTNTPSGSYIVADRTAYGQGNSSDFAFGGNEKIFAGYAYKKHHFELVIGSMKDRTKFSVNDSMQVPLADYSAYTRYTTIGVRYLYNSTPFKTNLIKMLIGPEIGYGLRSNLTLNNGMLGFQVGGHTGELFQDSISGTRFSVNSRNSNIHQFYVGFNARMDIKLFKNLTLVLNSNVVGFVMYSESYDVDMVFAGGTTNHYVVSGSSINVNLNAGLRFDLYSPKKKLQRYNELGIEDPYRNK